MSWPEQVFSHCVLIYALCVYSGITAELFSKSDKALYSTDPVARKEGIATMEVFCLGINHLFISRNSEQVPELARQGGDE